MVSPRCNVSIVPYDYFFTYVQAPCTKLFIAYDEHDDLPGFANQCLI